MNVRNRRAVETGRKSIVTNPQGFEEYRVSQRMREWGGFYFTCGQNMTSAGYINFLLIDSDCKFLSISLSLVLSHNNVA